MRISDWSPDVCSSDLTCTSQLAGVSADLGTCAVSACATHCTYADVRAFLVAGVFSFICWNAVTPIRSEEHTSELQSLMRISYAVFCLKKKKKTHQYQRPTEHPYCNWNKTNKKQRYR